MKKHSDFLKGWIIKAPIYFFIFIIISLVGMFSSNDFFSKLLTFLLVDIGFEYIFTNYLIIEKYRAKNSILLTQRNGKKVEGEYEENTIFNEDYFNLYSEISKVRLGLTLRVILFFIMVTSYLPAINWKILISYAVVACFMILDWIKNYFVSTFFAIFIAVLVSAFIVSKTEVSHMENLLLRKSNNFTPYTEEEKGILSEIKYKSKKRKNIDIKEHSNE